MDNQMQMLSQEIRRDWQRAYEEVERQLRAKDHDLRNALQAKAMLLNLLAQLRDNPAAVADRVDRVLGRVLGDEVIRLAAGWGVGIVCCGTFLRRMYDSVPFFFG